VEKNHGRIETRSYRQGERLAWFADRAPWAGLRSVGVVEAVRELKGQVQTELRCYLSRPALDAPRFARAVRAHWGVEKQLHWVRDVPFGEDQGRARSGHAAENLATLRRLALNLLKRDTTKQRGIVVNRRTPAGTSGISSNCRGFRCVCPETPRHP
jgi:predicted transposase YbfD/YdcC